MVVNKSSCSPDTCKLMIPKGFNRSMTAVGEVQKRGASLLNEPLTVAQHVVDNIEKLIQHWMYKCPDQEEMNKVISMLGKPPGAGKLHPEVIKRGSRKLVEVLNTVIKDAWENLEVLAGRKDAQLLTIFNKEDRQNCGDYCRILLLSISGKVFAPKLIKRLSTLVEDFLPEVQCGFNTNRGTMDMIFLLQMLEKCIDIYQFHKSLWHCEKGSAMEHPTETRVSW